MAGIMHESFNAGKHPEKPGVEIRPLLAGEVEGVEMEARLIRGPVTHTVTPRENAALILLFLSGRGACTAGGGSFSVDEKYIAASCRGIPFTVSVQEEESLVVFTVHKDFSAEDRERLSRPPFGSEEPYVRPFSRCRRYREHIKSEKTINTTLLPGGIVPRAAMGSVRTEGPDEVAPHAHEELEQFFLGLDGCRCTVRADCTSCLLTEYTLLHIPRDSMHTVSVAAGDACYYIWMDFFRSAADEAMLSQHVPVDEEE